MPAEAGIQNYWKTLDSRLRGNDVKGRFKTFYETIKIGVYSDSDFKIGTRIVTDRHGLLLIIVFLKAG